MTLQQFEELKKPTFRLPRKQKRRALKGLQDRINRLVFNKIKKEQDRIQRLRDQAKVKRSLQNEK